MGTISGAYELNQERTGTSDWITRSRTSNYILLCDKTRVPMFCFDSITTVPLQCAAPYFIV